MRGSGLDWTLVYPPVLSNAVPSGSYRYAEDLHVRGLKRVARADIADFMLAQLGDATFSRRNVIIST